MTRGAGARRRANNARAARHQAKLASQQAEPQLAPGELVSELLLRAPTDEQEQEPAVKKEDMEVDYGSSSCSPAKPRVEVPMPIAGSAIEEEVPMPIEVPSPPARAAPRFPLMKART